MRYVFGGILLLLALCISPSLSLSIPISSTTKEKGVGVGVDFDIDLAYNQLMYAYSAYCPEAILRAWNCTYCTFNTSTKDFKVDTVVDFSLSSTFGYVGSQGDKIIVAFRGTTDLENWIEDLDFTHSTPYKNVPDAWVHKGFYDSYELVKLQIRLSVQKLVSTVKASQVFITGHSLGGALATLSVLDLVSELKIPVTVYTYGSPRVGNQAFADYFHSKVANSFRVVNKADVVPHLPRFEQNYRHVAQEVWWKTNTLYRVCDMTGEDPFCSDSVLIYSKEDHLDYLGINKEAGTC